MDDDLAEALLHRYAERIQPDDPGPLRDLLEAAFGGDRHLLAALLVPVVREAVEEIVTGAGALP